MALNLQQLQKQTQRLVMTPQMQQSIQLLQLNSIELEQLAQQELLENPFLELDEEQSEDDAEPTPENAGENDDASADQDAEDPGEAPAESSPEPEPPRDTSSELKTPDPPDPGDDVAQDPARLESEPETFDNVDVDWEEFYYDSENPTYFGTREPDAEESDFSEYVANRTNLSDYLLWQLHCSSLEGRDVEIGEFLIGSMDEDGFLTPDVLDDAAAYFHIGREQVERVLHVLQEFDPPGVAARSLAECLLNQMKALGSYSELARRLLEEYMDEFQRKKFRELARKLGVDEHQIIELSHKICRLEPHPGRSISGDSVQYINPDVYVRQIDGELMIYLNEGQTSRLSVNQFYRRMLREKRNSLTQAEREYSTEKFRSALTLIKNIEKRKSTILRVTEAIMDVQHGFLEKGVSALKPLTLREVADMVGMHESTVARVTSRKYAETPQGLFPLKYFFSSSIESAGGAEAVSSRAIKEKLQQIIDAENPAKPLSDQKIADLLKHQGFDIARRTVAKYREQLKILPAKYRRQS